MPHSCHNCAHYEPGEDCAEGTCGHEPRHPTTCKDTCKFFQQKDELEMPTIKWGQVWEKIGVPMILIVVTAIGSFGAYALWADQHHALSAEQTKSHDQSLIDQGIKQAMSDMEAQKTRTTLQAVEAFKSAAEPQLNGIKIDINDIKTTIAEHGKGITDLRASTERIENSLKRFNRGSSSILDPPIMKKD